MKVIVQCVMCGEELVLDQDKNDSEATKYLCDKCIYEQAQDRKVCLNTLPLHLAKGNREARRKNK